MLASIEAFLSLMDYIRIRQFEDQKLCQLSNKLIRGEANETKLDSEDVLRIYSRVYMPKLGDLIRPILEEAHYTRDSIHSGAMKMYCDLRQHYRWRDIMTDISEFIARCLTCKQVKCKHLRLCGEVQRMPIPM